MSDSRCLFDQVTDFARHCADRTSLISGSRQISYSKLDERARRVGNGLLALKLDRPSRVAILCGNRHEFFEIWQGASMAGHILTPINARLAAREIEFILNDSQARLLFVDEAFHGLVQEISGELTAVKQIFTLGSHHEWLAYSEWRDGQSADQPSHSLIPPPYPEDTVVQMYTSGTTGFPKGVELSHASVLTCVRSMMGLAAWSSGEVALVTAPLFHTAGSAWAQCALQSGGTVVLLKELSPAAVLSAIEDHQVSKALLVEHLV